MYEKKKAVGALRHIIHTHTHYLPLSFVKIYFYVCTLFLTLSNEAPISLSYERILSRVEALDLSL